VDREEAIKRIMGGFDDVWMKGIQAKRAAKSGQGSPGEPPGDEPDPSPDRDREASEERDPNEREPDGDPDDGMDEETKAELLKLLSE